MCCFRNNKSPKTRECPDTVDPLAGALFLRSSHSPSFLGRYPCCTSSVHTADGIPRSAAGAGAGAGTTVQVGAGCSRGRRSGRTCKFILTWLGLASLLLSCFLFVTPVPPALSRSLITHQTTPNCASRPQTIPLTITSFQHLRSLAVQPDT